ncbi:hypothetical protein MW887_005778 [Aspergillus wentii]|nr:hypothetical protein MW887_005778 [Aspergillus wentii]
MLFVKHDATPAFAEEVASLWKLGRVRDLRQVTSFSRYLHPDLWGRIWAHAG